jgi:hypothetical protein
MAAMRLVVLSFGREPHGAGNLMSVVLDEVELVRK